MSRIAGLVHCALPEGGITPVNKTDSPALGEFTSQRTRAWKGSFVREERMKARPRAAIPTLTFTLTEFPAETHRADSSQPPQASSAWANFPGLLTRLQHPVSLSVNWQNVGWILYMLDNLMESAALSVFRMTLAETTPRDWITVLAPGYKPSPRLFHSFFLYPLPTSWHTAGTPHTLAKETRSFSHVWSRQRKRLPKICPLRELTLLLLLSLKWTERSTL